MSYLKEMFGLEGKTAVVAGGAGVIGTLMSRTLLRAGANVVIWSRSKASIDQALAALTAESAHTNRVAGYQLDAGREDEVRSGLDHAVATFGAPAILINAVGGTGGKSAFVDIDTEKFAQVLHLNLVAGLVVPTKVTAAYWIENQVRGAIINLTSMTSYNPLSGVWDYDAAKAGVLNLTVATAKEFAPHRIRVNAIAPGFFLGKQNRALLVDEATGDYTARGQAIIAHTPFGRFGEVAELEGATLFLASNRAAGFVTGVSIPVDGGYLAHNI